MPTSLLIDEIALVSLSGLLAWAAIRDFRTFTIPNWISIAVVLLFAAHGLCAPHSVNWINSLIAGIVMFVGGLALFGANLMGGGDVKLLAALGLWAGLQQIMQFLLVTSIAGGLLAVAFASRHWLSRHSLSHVAGAAAGEQASIRSAALPYGVAIACGGLYITARLFTQ
jgi:prepilin peptidase CpaA